MSLPRPSLRPEIIGYLKGDNSSDDPTSVMRLSRSYAGRASLQLVGGTLTPTSRLGDAQAGPSSSDASVQAASFLQLREGALAMPTELYCSPSLSSAYYYVVDPATLEISKQKFSDGLKFDWGAFFAEPDCADPGSYLCAGTRIGEGYVIYSLSLGTDGRPYY